MHIPPLIIANADDIGLRSSVNKAILYSFEQGYINSTSLLTNMGCFDETIDFIHSNAAITNIGLHGNFAEGRPVTNFKYTEFLDVNGNWNLKQTGKRINFLSKDAKNAFANELSAQLGKAQAGKIKITHLDSHLHLHTLPAFCDIYIELAKRYDLRLRLAQTYNEGNYVKYLYRKFLNDKIKSNKLSHSDLFEDVSHYLNSGDKNGQGIVEIMVHPDFDDNGRLFDHVDGTSMDMWVEHLKNAMA